MCSFVLVNFKTCCTEIFVLYSSHYCLFLWLLWSQIGDKFGIPCSCHGTMLCGISAIILLCHQKNVWLHGMANSFSCDHVFSCVANRDWSPVYMTAFWAWCPFEFGPGAWNLGPETLHFCRVNGKIWGTCAMNFSIYTASVGGAGSQVLGTGAKFRRVPCQKGCRINLAWVMPCVVVLWLMLWQSVIIIIETSSHFKSLYITFHMHHIPPSKTKVSFNVF